MTFVASKLSNRLHHYSATIRRSRRTIGIVLVLVALLALVNTGSRKQRNVAVRAPTTVPFLERAQIQQESFCNIRGQLNFTGQSAAQVSYDDGLQHIMMVHAEGDTVSSEVMKTGIWEKENTRQILAGLSLVSEVRGREAAGFIDIGANVGWFSLMVARRGYKVSAVEPSPRNQLCIRHSTCLNADLGKQIILYDMGMAEDPDVCHLYTQDGNNGNAMLECGKTENETPKPSIFNDGPYWYQATVKVSTLDDTFGKKGDNSVGTYGVMKLDVEGLEPEVLLGGATEFFAKHNAPAIAVMEFCPTRLAGHPKYGNDIAKALRVWDSFGYAIYLDGFFPPSSILSPGQPASSLARSLGQGRVLCSDDFNVWASQVKGYPDIFMIHRSFLKEVEESYAK